MAFLRLRSCLPGSEVVSMSGARPHRADSSSDVCSIRLFDGNPLGALRHGDYYVAAVVSVVDVPVRVDDVVQGIGAVDHGPDFTGRRQLAE